MQKSKKALLAAGLLAGAAAMTGCTANTMPAPTPQAAKETAQPETAVKTQEAEEPLALSVGGKEVPAGALREQDGLMLPLVETGEALGWKSESDTAQEEGKTQRTVTLEKDGSRITVSWAVSDNTAKNIVWQKDGLLIPVNTRLTTKEDTVFVPAAFFEEAADAVVSEEKGGVSVEPAKSNATPPTQPQQTLKPTGKPTEGNG